MSIASQIILWHVALLVLWPIGMVLIDRFHREPSLSLLSSVLLVVSWLALLFSFFAFGMSLYHEIKSKR